MAIDVEVMESRNLPSSDPERRGKMDTLILYKAPGPAQYTLVIPLDEPKETDIIAAIKADVARRRAATALKFTID